MRFVAGLRKCDEPCVSKLVLLASNLEHFFYNSFGKKLEKSMFFVAG